METSPNHQPDMYKQVGSSATESVVGKRAVVNMLIPSVSLHTFGEIRAFAEWTSSERCHAFQDSTFSATFLHFVRPVLHLAGFPIFANAQLKLRVLERNANFIPTCRRPWGMLEEWGVPPQIKLGAGKVGINVLESSREGEQIFQGRPNLVRPVFRPEAAHRGDFLESSCIDCKKRPWPYDVVE